MDTIRAKEIMKSQDNVQVLFRGIPVWLENINENNTATVMRLDNKQKEEVPVYLLVENPNLM